MKQRLLGVIAWFFYMLLSRSWRLTVIEHPSLKENMMNGNPFILAHWHGDELPLACLIGYYRVATIVSTSRDGEIMTQVVRLVGGRTSRGSSTRGGISALLTLLRIIRDEKRNCSFAVDGPKGPLHVVKPGVFEMSRLLGSAPIYPAGIAYDRAWHFSKSWNQAYLPKPFARVVVHWGDPMAVNKDMDPRSEELQKDLANALHNSKAEALKKFAALSS